MKEFKGHEGKQQWKFHEIQKMDELKKLEMMNDILDKQKEIIYTREDSRHLSLAATEGRRLRSAFDIFDFVDNAVSSGVAEARHNTKKALTTAARFDLDEAKKVAKDAKKLEQSIETATEAVAEEIENIFNLSEPTETVEVAEPVQEEPKLEAAAPVEETKNIEMFEVEEIEAMKTLADMGRLFNDEDEAKLVKLTEDLSDWLNKWALTFDDPESVLFEVATSLVTDEMLMDVDHMVPETVEEPVEEVVKEIETPAAPEDTVIQISFTFGDNGDWFTFEQTIVQEQNVEITYDFDFDNIWAEMTKGIKELDDWSKLNDDEWAKLVNPQKVDD